MELRFFEIYRNPEYLWLLAEGVGFSAALTLAGAVLGFILACGLAVARHEQIPVLRWIAAAYVDFIRQSAAYGKAAEGQMIADRARVWGV